MLNHLKTARVLVDRCGLGHDPEVETILELLAQIDDEEEAKDLMEYLDMKCKEQYIRFNPFLPHPPEETIAGEVTFGLTELGFPAGINLSELAQGGILTTGRTGAGKTNTVAVILSEIARKMPGKAAVWIFETSKKSYRHIMPSDTLIIPYKVDRFNCLREPPGCDWMDWMMGMTELLAQYAGLLLAGMNMCYETLIELKEIYRISDGSNVRPTLLDIQLVMAAKREKYQNNKDFSKVGYCDRWLNKLVPFVTGLRDVVGVDSGYPLEELIDRNVVWELTGLTVPLQSFFINAKLFWKLEFKKANPGKIQGICVNVFDEAERVFGINLFED
jgi:hypothetical protein